MTSVDNNGFPNVGAPFVNPANGTLNQVWYYLLLSLWNRTGGGAPSGGGFTSIPVSGTSPFSYTATKAGNIFVSPGCYANVTITRGAKSLEYGYITRGIFPVSQNDIITFVFTNYPPVIYLI